VLTRFPRRDRAARSIRAALLTTARRTRKAASAVALARRFPGLHFKYTTTTARVEAASRRRRRRFGRAMVETLRPRSVHRLGFQLPGVRRQPAELCEKPPTRRRRLSQSERDSIFSRAPPTRSNRPGFELPTSLTLPVAARSRTRSSRPATRASRRWRSPPCGSGVGHEVMPAALPSGASYLEPRSLSPSSSAPRSLIGI